MMRHAAPVCRAADRCASVTGADARHAGRLCGPALALMIRSEVSVRERVEQLWCGEFPFGCRGAASVCWSRAGWCVVLIRTSIFPMSAAGVYWAI